ncbi:MAG: type II toxin-antitoxin system VapB family antitoxin [Candidatus Bipolaricaulaceae bacterium]
MTVTIDDELLSEALRVSKARTKREVIEIALRELVRRERRRAVIAHAGAIDLALTQEGLKRWREER